MASIEGTNPGYYGRINFFIDATDDPLLADSVPSFDGGQFSNLRGNLLQANQSKALTNCDVDKLGKLRTRRGSQRISADPPCGLAARVVQGLTSYQTPTANYIVAAQNAKLWAWTGSVWVQIALGGTADGEDIVIARTGAINQATPPAGYVAGTTVLTVDGITGVVGVGEKLYFTNNLRTDYFEYTIAAQNGVVGAASTTQITLEDPGLVFDVKDNWAFTVLRPAKVHNAVAGNRYLAGATAMDISNYGSAIGGTVNVGEKFVIKSENVTHTVATATGTPTTHITFGVGPDVGLQADWVGAGGVSAPVMFAQGNDALYFTDGTGPIYGWKGPIPSSPTTGGGTLTQIGSYSILDSFNGTFHSSRTTPPQNVKVLLWFQNRLIASGIALEPDAIYFSDFFDATSWDQDYQKVRIGGGESDPITGCLAWTDLNMIVFKKNSCYLINLDPSQNPDPADPTLLVASFAVKQLHKLIGCPAPLTAVQVGGGSTTPGSDVFFVDGDKKVHSIRRVMAAETQQEVGVAMSLPIQDVMDTIDIAHIDKCVAMYHNEHYILGFPDLLASGIANFPDKVVAYNLLTQSWCSGNWSWAPSCFSRRTDLGSYSKLIFGETYLDTGSGLLKGSVMQWMDDLSLQEEDDNTYQDRVFAGVGDDIGTTVLTRAFTGGDYYSFKTGLSVEFEFDESVSAAVTVQVILDMVPQTELIAIPFSSLSEPRLTVPFVIPAVLPGSPGLLRKAFDLQRYGTWRELQFRISTAAGKLAIRSIRVTFFMDTIQLQTLPFDFVVSNPENVTGDDGLLVTGDDGTTVVTM